MAQTFTASHRGGDGPPLVLLHGFTDTWRTWELTLPPLERDHDVLAPTLAGHAGGPPIEGSMSRDVLADAVERALDAAGIGTAHLAGNSLGGYVAFQLAARGRARSVVALAPAGGWGEGDRMPLRTAAFFRDMQSALKLAAPHAESILSTDDGRRRATLFTAMNYEHIPSELLAHQLVGAATCRSAETMIDYALREGYAIDPEKITCPVRIVWGTADQVLPWPAAASRFREEWFPHADWVELDGVGHCPQLDVPLETAELIGGFSR